MQTSLQSCKRPLRPQPLKNQLNHVSDFLLADKNIKHHQCQPCTCWTVEEMSCFLHLPALLTPLTDVEEDHVLSFRLRSVDRAREDGGISGLVWTCSLAMPNKEMSLGLTNEYVWQGAMRKGSPRGNWEHIQTPSGSSRSFPESDKPNHWSQSYSYTDPRLTTLSLLRFAPLCFPWAALKQRWVVMTMSDCNILPSLGTHKSGISPDHYQPQLIPRKELLMEWQMQLLSTTLRSLNSGDHCTSLLSVFSLSRLQSINPCCPRLWTAGRSVTIHKQAYNDRPSPKPMSVLTVTLCSPCSARFDNCLNCNFHQAC